MPDPLACARVLFFGGLLALASAGPTHAQALAPTAARVDTVELHWSPEFDAVHARRQGRVLVLEGTVLREADRAPAEAVRQTRAETGDSNLMQRGERE